MRQQLVDQWVLFYQAENPEADAEVCQVFREYLEMLIQRKLAKYPHCNREIISCELNEMDDGQDHITIASAMMPEP